MRPLDEWRGVTTVASIGSLDELDAYERAFDGDAALGAHEPMTDVERAACAQRRAELHEARNDALRAERDEIRRRR